MFENLLWHWLIAFRDVNSGGRNFTTAEVAVLFSLATRADGRGTGIHRGVRGVVSDLRVKDETVTSALAKARGMSVMIRVRKGRRGSNQADTYALVHPDQWRLDHARNRPGTDEPPW